MHKSLFAHGRKPTIRLIVLAMISMALIYYDQRTDKLEPLRSSLALLTYPVQILVDLPFRASTWIGQSLTGREELVEENKRLRRENLLLSSQVQRLRSLDRENRELRDLLQAAQHTEAEFTSARLLAISMNPSEQRVVVNKGKKHGIETGMPLMDSRGVMGQITRVYPFHAEGILISDPEYAIPVQLSRTGLRSILAGEGNSQSLKLLYISNNADIKVGDQLLTSGLGGRFPPNYPVATITAIEKLDSAPFARVTAKALAHLNRSQDVLLLNVAQSSQTTTQEPAPQ
ncbi:MAG: rod shape-determining protein MreC [Thiotrichales bacterium]